MELTEGAIRLHLTEQNNMAVSMNENTICFMIVHTYLSCPKLLFACIFLDDGCLGKVVHDLSVVGADELALKMLA